MIRKVLLSTVAFVTISGTAFAADLPSRRAPPVYIPPPIPVFSWTGFYIGGDVGYAFGRDKAQATTLGGTALTQQFNVGQHDGIIGGGHIGYNLSTQSFPLLAGFGGAGGVIGIEGDITGSDYRGSFGTIGFNPAVHTQSQVQGSVRGRLGIAADRALFFVTGGAAVAEFKGRLRVGREPLARSHRLDRRWRRRIRADHQLVAAWRVSLQRLRYVPRHHPGDAEPLLGLAPEHHAARDRRLQLQVRDADGSPGRGPLLSGLRPPGYEEPGLAPGFSF